MRSHRHRIVSQSRLFGGAIDRGGPRARYTRHRQAATTKFDPRSFRTIAIGRGQKAVVGCPAGQYDARRQRCKVGTRIQSVLKPKGRR